jgi:hypothetical protein
MHGASENRKEFYSIEPLQQEGWSNGVMEYWFLDA